MNQKKIRLAILSHHPSQYEGPMFRKLAKYNGIDLNVFYISDLGISSKADPETKIIVDWDIPILDGYKSEIISDLHLIKYIQKINAKNFDFIIIAGYTTFVSWLTILKARIEGIDILFRADTTLLYQDKLPFWKKAIKKILSKFLFPSFKAFLPVGTLSMECFHFYGVPKNKTFLVPYAVNNEYFKESCSIHKSEKTNIKKNLGIGSNRTVILAVVKFVERESPMDLIKAYASLNNRDKASLIIIGDGEQRQAMEDYIHLHDLRDVHLVGYKRYSELSMFYAISDVFVHPAIREPWGLSVNEAMACGLPVITSNLVGSSKDLIINGVNGYTYFAGQTDSLASILDLFIDNPSLSNRMGHHSQEIISTWDYDRCVEGIMNAISFIQMNKLREK